MTDMPGGWLQTANKLYLTTVSHHEEYYNMLKSLPDVQCNDEGEVCTACARWWILQACPDNNGVYLRWHK